jgi:hypothetical protein
MNYSSRIQGIIITFYLELSAGMCRRFVKSKAAIVSPAGQPFQKIDFGSQTPSTYAEGVQARDRRRHETARRSFLHLAAGAAVVLVATRTASALDYPAQPVHIVVGFIGGRTPDLNARLIGQWLWERLVQSFVIDNQPRVGTNIATEAVVRASPDGYVLLVAKRPSSETS